MRSDESRTGHRVSNAAAGLTRPGDRLVDASGIGWLQGAYVKATGGDRMPCCTFVNGCSRALVAVANSHLHLESLI
eukprot:361647-Chlamydomonas_euryale.AAC.3